MNFYNREEARQRMNDLAEQAVPFLFIIDYDSKRAVVEPENGVDANELKYCFNGIGNATQTSHSTNNDIEWRIEPPTEAEYQHSFNIVRNAMLAGNSYLANLTCRVGLQTNLSLPCGQCALSALDERQASVFLARDVCKDFARGD